MLPFENASAGNYYYGGVKDGGPGASATFRGFVERRNFPIRGCPHVTLFAGGGEGVEQLLTIADRAGG